MPMLEVQGHSPIERLTYGDGSTPPTPYDETMLACFLASARCGCFMQAARSLNLTAPVLRKKLARLETQLGVVLFVNRDHTVVLTRQGRQLKNMLEARQERLADASAVRQLRLAVCEPLLRDFLGRNLVTFIRQLAGVRLELVSQPGSDTDVLLCLSDDALQPPPAPFDDGQAQRLAVLDYLPHIAKRYCREANRPTNAQALQDYMLLQWQADRHVPALEPWHRVLAAHEGGVTQLEGYEMFVQLIRCSASIGLLPHYAAKSDRSLMPLPGVVAQPMQRGVWLMLNRQSAKDPLVLRLAESIKATFDERRDWF
ncbi:MULTISPECIES: LysR family transcriptional regulator [Pseudomonas]|uniref:LysR family transcriptional regulator n=1 Tax=Pseudomonas TaxID=286 RepID=UPI001E2B3729|nr:MULTISPECIES: LysR family transcriptional regulator [Pseudomonas]MCE1117210.1 LysR family transcriptional regulator [Pseudomonas sp. NMI795_08]